MPAMPPAPSWCDVRPAIAEPAGRVNADRGRVAE